MRRQARSEILYADAARWYALRITIVVGGVVVIVLGAMFIVTLV